MRLECALTGPCSCAFRHQAHRVRHRTSHACGHAQTLMAWCDRDRHQGEHGCLDASGVGLAGTSQEIQGHFCLNLNCSSFYSTVNHHIFSTALLSNFPTAEALRYRWSCRCTVLSVATLLLCCNCNLVQRIVSHLLVLWVFTERTRTSSGQS